MQKEPVAIIGAIMAVVMALITFGILDWTEAQVSAFEQVLIANIPLLVVGLGSWAQRSKVFSPDTVRRMQASRNESDKQS